MTSNETKNRIIDNPFDMDVIDMILENTRDERRYLGTEKRRHQGLLGQSKKPSQRKHV